MRLARSIHWTLRAAALGCLAACGDPRTVEIEVTTGQEEGELGLDPAITAVEIVAFDPDNKIVAQASAAPGEEFDLGEISDRAILRFELTGRTADDEVAARGRSVPIAIGGLDLGTEALPLFIQRLGGFARPPGGLIRAHVHPPGGTIGERFLVATGGDTAFASEGEVDPALGDYYDMVGFAGFESAAALPRAAKSLVVRGGSLILINDDGASFADLEAGTTNELTPPEGFEFSEVSGGLALDFPPRGTEVIGTTVVIGATRPEGPTDAVLVVDPSGKVSGLRLAQAREGAAALYVEGVGMVIAGGSDEGPGIEVIGDDETTVSSLPFPPDASTGAAAAVIAEQKIALLGGRLGADPAPARTLDLRCSTETDCVEDTSTPDIELPLLATRGRAFTVPQGVLVFGEAEPEEDDEIGETLAFLVDVAAEDEVALPLREPRRGATPVPAPNGTLAVIGGLTLSGAPARSIETIFPE